MTNPNLGRQFDRTTYGPLFHGTSASLNPGDVVAPRTKSIAHAAPSLITARVFAGKAGSVYEVEPVDRSDVWSRQMKYTGNEHHDEALSPSGFRVVAKVPKSRRDSHYDDRRVSGVQQYRADRGLEFCRSCHGEHPIGEHGA